MTPEIVHRAAEILQEAFAESESWSFALDEVSRLMGARGAAIIPLTPGNLDRPASNTLVDLLDEYNRYWHRHDFRYAAIGKILKTGIGVDQDIVSPDEIKRLPFYDYLAKHKLRWFAGVPFCDGPDRWILTFQRTQDQGLYKLEEQNQLRQLGCALSQSVSLARRLAASRAAGLVEGLMLAGSSAVLLDRKGIVLDVDATLKDELRRELRITIGRPMLGVTTLQAALLEKMNAALHLHLQPDNRALLPLAVARHGRRPVLLRLRVLAGESARFYHRAVAIVLIDDPDRNDPLSLDILKSAFGFTPAQARVAACIGSGKAIKTCADDLGIGVETVRTTLQKVFHKVGVSRQSELVRVISQLPRL